MKRTGDQETQEQRMFSVVARYEASGLSRKKFCDREGMPVYLLKYWCDKKRKAKAESNASFVEVSTSTAEPEVYYRMELELASGLTLRLADDFDAASVKRLVDALERA